MNITVIYGQGHRGNTWALTQLFLERLHDYNTHVDEFFLPDDRIGYCIGCQNCIMHSEHNCPHADAVQEIVSSIDIADVIIIASPGYVLNMTGQLKTLFDHLAYRFMSHRPEPSMFSKQAIALSTVAGIGMTKTVKAISGNLFWWGIARTYRYGLRIAATDFEHIADTRKKRIRRKADRIVRRIKKNEKRAKPGIKAKLIFSFMRIGQKKNDWNPVDKEYWQRNGWLDNSRPY